MDFKRSFCNVVYSFPNVSVNLTAYDKYGTLIPSSSNDTIIPILYSSDGSFAPMSFLTTNYI